MKQSDIDKLEAMRIPYDTFTGRRVDWQPRPTGTIRLNDEEDDA